ncbi:MAG TPA: haloacid dehalogenase type II [Chloroflexia bacterium]|nr:haloacid dehalogenase type II [Chloroflexia bacterium]
MSRLKAFVFDAYGTLFDVRSVQSRCEEVFPGYGAAITTMWRTKQLEYSWLRSLMNRYADFWQVTEDGLRYTCLALGLEPDQTALERIMESYLSIAPYPDTGQALQALAPYPLAILSNGTPSMLEAAVRNAGLEAVFSAVLSVDEIQIYKPHPSVYGLATAKLNLPPEEIAFVSSNGWDVAGAKAFGFYVCWLNRTNAPVEELDVRPDLIIASPLELAKLTS